MCITCYYEERKIRSQKNKIKDLVEKTCTGKCGKTMLSTLFIPDRNICRDCFNENKRVPKKPSPTEKTCKGKCGETLPVSSFYNHTHVCRECIKEIQRNRYHEKKNN